MAAITAVVAVPIVLMPSLTPSDVQFGVRVPPEKRSDLTILRAVRNYRIGMVATLGLAAVAIAVGALASSPALVLLAPLALVGGTAATYVVVRQPIVQAKAREGWVARGPTFIGGPLLHGADDRGWLLWLAPAVAIWVGTVVAGVVLYPSLPATLPTHFGGSGSADAYTSKSVAAAFSLSIVGAILLAIFSGIAVTLSRRREPLDASDPARDAVRQRGFRSWMVRGLLLLATGTQLTTSIAALLVWTVLPAESWVPILLLAPILGATIGLVVITVRVGQLGARLAPDPHPGAPTGPVAGAGGPADDDRFWKAGLFYYNPDDSSLLVPKRFGVGWTLNFASPWAWGILAVPVVLLVLFGI